MPTANGLDITVEHKYYVNSPAGLLGVYLVTAVSSGASVEMRYYHRDHLGSIIAITNEAGSKIESLAYEAFGERRNANGDMEDKTSSILGLKTDRGFTGHEHLDELNLIHMNGRIYDPVIGRFMTPDPQIQYPANLQSYNRYTYGFNNPLSGADPSGYSWFSDIFRAVAIAVVAYYTGGAISGWAESAYLTSAGASWGNIAIAQTVGAVAGGAAGGFTAGFLSSGGNFNAGVQGAFSGALFGAASGVGSSFSAERIAAHALAGCVSASAGGGNCAQGAISAAVGKTATGLFTESGSWGDKNLNDFTRGIAVAGAGGIGSVLAGGKFDNGAKTAAFGYIFNYCTESSGRCTFQKILNGAKIAGGILQTFAGGAMCVASAGMACLAGAPIAAVGASQIAEGATYFNERGTEEGFNPTRVTLQRVAGDGLGTHLYTAAEVGTALGVNAAPVVVSKWKLFYPDTLPKIETLSSGAAAFQATTISGKLADPLYRDNVSK